MASRETRPLQADSPSSTRFSSHREHARKVENLLSELKKDERMIINEVGPILNEIQGAASQKPETFIEIADQKIKEIQSEEIISKS